MSEHHGCLGLEHRATSEPTADGLDHRPGCYARFLSEYECF
jgi:hypothetical protein